MSDIDDGEDGFPIRPKPQPTAGEQALLNFSINNKDLEKLESIIGVFNPFKILGIQDFEIRHSNVLSWLIDPDGHHGLGDTLFKNLLLEVMKEGEVSLSQINDTISASFSDLRVMREWNNIDILAVSQANRLVLVIENKFHAEESDNQLTKYVNIINKKYPDYTKAFVFLSLGGITPKGSDLYIQCTYKQIYSIVQSTVDLRKDYMHEKVYNFIQQYLQILEENTMQNADLINICGKLYRDHKEAINAIMLYGRPRLQPQNMIEFHKQTATESVHSGKESVNVFYTFIPDKWKGIVPETNKYTSDKYLVFFTLNFTDYEDHKVGLSLNIGNFPDAVEREQFMAQVITADKDSNLRKIKTSAKTNTIVFSKSISLKDGNDAYDIENYEAIIEKLAEVYNDTDVQQALKVMDGVVQQFKFKK